MRSSQFTMGHIKKSIQATIFAFPLYSLTLKGRAPHKLLATPLDPWPGHPDAAISLLGNRYVFAGQAFSGEDVPWMPSSATSSWVQAMHGFEWLRDLRSVGTDVARRQARKLVSSWLDHYGLAWDSVTWAPPVLGARIANWLGHYDFLWASADDDLRLKIFDSLGRQIRHLGRAVDHVSSGLDQLLVIKGLLYGAVFLTGQGRTVIQGLRHLVRHIQRHILPDGGYVERNPTLLMHTLRHYIDIRSALRAGRVEIPEMLQQAIDRMAPALRFFRHGDGGLALFNGGDEQQSLLIDMILTLADARGRPLKSAVHSGFERLALGRSLVIMDVGVPAEAPWDNMAHAGTLGFEMSHGRERVIVNCGAHPDHTGPWRLAMAATAAHSTLVVNDTNSAEVLAEGGLGRRPEVVRAERSETESLILVEASHDGYLTTLGYVHKRRLYLAQGGDELRGEDVLEGPGDRPYALRFHLHPLVQASLIQSGEAVLIRLPSGTGWRFKASSSGTLSIEESFYCGMGEPRRSLQIIFAGQTLGRQSIIQWSIQREKNKT